jgi:putative toxin-antitoxin system antitoxin component (TIGR02293 family)
MKSDIFEKLLASVKEGAEILSGRHRHSRRTQISARALGLFDGDVAAARQWLSNPQPVLGGAIPLEMARTAHGAREVEDAISRLEHGVFS